MPFPPEEPQPSDMAIQRSTMPRIRVRVPASTSNLGPGFDSLGLALSLCNDVALACEGLKPIEGEAAAPSVEVRVRGIGQDELPRDESSLVWQAAAKVFPEAGLAVERVRIDCVNRVPLDSGLGSSSAACVGGIVAANEMCGRRLPPHRLLEIATALEGHPDNAAAALLGGFTVAWDANGKPVAARAPLRSRLQVVVCTPALRLATMKARAALPERVPHRDAVLAVGRAAGLVALLATGGLDALGAAMEDTLHQPYRAPLMPGLEQALAEARHQGAVSAAVSGAGPSLVAFVPASVPETAERVSRTLEECFGNQGVEAESRILSVDRKGARVLKAIR